MNQFFEKYPWLRTMLCGLMAAALLLSVLLPVLRLQRQELRKIRSGRKIFSRWSH